MYHIVKDVASLITTSSEMTVFLSGHTFQTGRLNTAKLGQLTICRKKLSDSIDPFKEKTNPDRTLLLDPQRAGFMVNPNGIFVMVVRNCMNIPKYTLIVYTSL